METRQVLDGTAPEGRNAAGSPASGPGAPPGGSGSQAAPARRLWCHPWALSPRHGRVLLLSRRLRSRRSPRPWSVATATPCRQLRPTRCRRGTRQQRPPCCPWRTARRSRRSAVRLRPADVHWNPRARLPGQAGFDSLSAQDPVGARRAATGCRRGDRQARVTRRALYAASLRPATARSGGPGGRLGPCRGVDTVAHESALAAGGATWAVLGSGVDVPTPVSNSALAEEIVSCGGGPHIRGATGNTGKPEPAGRP